MMKKTAVFVCVLAPFLFSSCAKPAETPHYSVRAVVAEINLNEGQNGQLKLLHEAIPDFRNAAGNIVGMQSMIMKFDLSPEVSAGELALKDKVAIQFDVNWYKNPRLVITQLEKLDADTVLDLNGYSLE
ncbi:MAG: copper-binding protein [Candidatus Omnitrophica bacterium]|nr:copper-binding protein [Candidatus Omnitrophota bacterium]